MLLKEPQVDPSAEHSVLRYATSAGNIRTIGLLLEDGKANPHDCGSYALHVVVYRRYYAVVHCCKMAVSMSMLTMIMYSSLQIPINS